MGDTHQEENFLVVGMGASAGGIEAFKYFFQAVPDDSGMAFVLVQHLDPTHESLMAELISRYTQMEVRQASDGIKVQPNHVYIIPPNKTLTISQGRLHTAAPERHRGMRAPIDEFFRSLAAECGERAVGIVLSGTASDGTLGLKEIKLRGGLSIAQDPDEAQQDGMPRSALNAGAVDYAVPAAQMPGLLREYAQHPYVTRKEGHASDDAKDAIGLDGILAVLRIRLGHDFRGYKKGTLLRRVHRRMGIQSIEDMRRYRDFLREHPLEVKALLQDLLIGVTTFFRESEAWEELAEKVIPSLFRRRQPDNPIRIWVAGCSTGKEAYSLMMLLVEEAEKRDVRLHCQMFATDIDQEALETAREGVYPAQIAEEIPPERLNRFFVKHGNTYQIRNDLRERITFAAQNIVTDPPFSNLDMISCRNLLIYLDLQVQTRLVDLFHFALADRGYLLLGNSESVSNQDNVFETISRKWRIYRKVGSSRPARLDLPLVKPAPDRSIPLQPSRRTPQVAREKTPAFLAERALLDYFAPAAVLADDRCNVLYFYGNTDTFLTFHEGEPTRDLLSLVRKGLRGRLRAAVKRACEEGEETVFRGHAVQGKEAQPTQITTIPVAKEKMAVVIFEAEGPPVEHTSEPLSTEEVNVRELEDELKSTREELQSTIEELETSNEELKAANEEAMSMNEELQSTNEELETSKEELQSVNEELTTVNAQLQEKVDELEQTTNDLDNLITSTDIATIFLDSELRLKRYSPATTELLNLLPGDVGRPISDISSRVAGMNLPEDAKRVLKELKPRAREFEADDGKWYIRKTLPYRTSRNAVEGAVITFVDVTDLKEAQAKAASRSEELEILMESVPAAVWIATDRSCRQITGNQLGYRMLHLETGKNVSKSAPEPERPGYRAFQDDRELSPDELPLQRVAATGEPLEGFEVDILFEDGQTITIFGNAVPLKDQEGNVRGAIAAFIDITARKRAQKAMIKNEQLYRLAAQAAHFGTYERNLVTGQDVWTPELKAIYGLGPDDPLPLRDGIPEAVHPDDRQRVLEETEARIAPDAPEQYGTELRVVRPDGEVRWILVRGRVEFSGEGADRHAVRKYGFAMDFTERKDMEVQLKDVNAHLEETVRDKTEEVRRQAEQLRSLVRQLTDAEQRERRRLSAVLHDNLQQLLMGARYQLETAEKRVDDKKAIAAMNNAGGILFEAMNVSKNLAVELSPPILYDGAFENAMRWLAEHMRERHGLNVAIRSDLGDRRVEERRRIMLFECIRELLLNIVKHSGTDHAVVELHMAASNVLRTTISDNGNGFDINSLGQDSTSSHYGLFHVRQRIEGAGGKLEVDSRPSEGTKITLICPIGNPKKAASGGHKAPARRLRKSRSDGNSIRVLVADDHTIFRQGLRTMLELEDDFEIVGEAATGRQAVELTHKLQPDVVLMDVNMPETNGIEATRQLRDELPDVMVIGLTMHEEPSITSDMIDAGASAVFHKSTDTRGFCEEIRNTIGDGNGRPGTSRKKDTPPRED